jgi:hypothetical protein
LALAAILTIAGELVGARPVHPVPSRVDEGGSIDEPEPTATPDAVSSSPSPAVNPAPGEAGPPLSEDALLHQLARLNVTDKPRALALALEADDAYPGTGVRAEARRAMIITLLVDLDRMDEARQRVRLYLEAYPDSRYLPLIEGKTGIHPRPQGPR